MDTECAECDNKIAFNFTASEYPIDSLNYVESEVSDAITEDEPYIEYLPELYEAQYLDLATASAVEIIRGIQYDKDVLRDISSRQFEEVVAELFRSKGY
ncbi:hypothetical protein DSM25558_3210 [Agrobacterium sp. DSM 25558]|nr:hypothetical protein DSM25558_3210 [Agrobacterium sp. DSM 25558]